jgi:two-component system, OmpR family, sensor histidine kinase CiaH
MNRLFLRIRWRLVGWTMLILAVLLFGLGTIIYAAVARSLGGEVDRTLLQASEQALPNLFGQPGGRDRRDLREREGYRGGVFYIALLPDGTLLANPQQVDVTDLSWVQPGFGQATISTTALNDEPTRVVARRAPDGGTILVGQSLAPEEAALHSLLLVLLAGGGLGLLLSFAVAWFLSGRALVPIQQAFARQQEFVADASHELRTPLTVLRSTTDVLDRHRTEPLASNGELFDDMRAEIARMERLAADLLTLARSDGGELELMTAPLDLGQLTGDLVRRVTPLADGRGVELRSEVVGESPTVEADPDRLQQVLLVLLDNAIKHTPSGGHVKVRVHPQAGNAIVDVIDTGSGIPAEDLPRIFDRFYRADKARSSGGTGLGLAIAKMLVDAHHGHLSVASTQGAGTRFSICLPLVDRPATLGHRLGELAAHLTPQRH